MSPHTAPHVYVDCDLPEDMTLDAWRRSRSRPRPATPAVRVRRASARLARRLTLRG